MPTTPGPHPLLCRRKNQLAAGTIVPPGVETLRCAGCDAKVLASPASARMVRRGEARPLCDRCVPPDVNLAVMTAEQTAELEQYHSQHERN